jgi:hypothetical protein
VLSEVAEAIQCQREWDSNEDIERDEPFHKESTRELGPSIGAVALAVHDFEFPPTPRRLSTMAADKSSSDFCLQWSIPRRE